MSKRIAGTKPHTSLALAAFALSASLMGAALPLHARMALAEDDITVAEETEASDTLASVSDEGVTLPYAEGEPYTVVEAQAEEPSVTYQAHVQNIGWMDWAADGETAGTEGRSLQVEAISMKVGGLPDGSIRYRTHLQDVGWQDWRGDGEVAGTTGQSRRVEAVRIELTGDAASRYDVLYRVHVPNMGWLGWAKNGEVAGSEGMALRIEALQVRIVPAGTEKSGLHSLSKPELRVKAHSANVGWQPSVGEGVVAGTTNRALRLEALKLTMPGFDGAGGAISARAHVSNVGWMNWTSSGEVTGTTGRGLAMEAVQISLIGDVASFFDVYYRAHVSNYGWLGWACNGQTAGSTGMSLPMEAIEVRVVPKGSVFNCGGSATVQPVPQPQAAASAQTSAYDTEVSGFLSDSRWAAGTRWTSGQRPKISGYGAYGCCAYAADFCKYVFGADSYREGEEFHSPSEIRAGDIIKVTGGQHWFVVLGRDGDSLWTAEGNWEGKVVVADGTYTVSGNALCHNGSRFRTFSAGYHMQ